MPSNDETIHSSRAAETQEFIGKKSPDKTLLDYISLAVATFGVGYLPLAPGTFGSAVGVFIYVAVFTAESNLSIDLVNRGWKPEQILAWVDGVNSIALLLFCFLGIWASSRAARIFQTKDPQKVVVDEVLGQLIVFAFVPFLFSWKLILAGFVLFRLFDIWKPYPINSLENLPNGIGVCADDILAGVYGGICLAMIYALTISF